MASASGGAVLRAIRTATAGREATDRELLGRYAVGDQEAFAALVRRHGGMVFGVCRRALPTSQDAEDACQAVFLVLARKAGSRRWRSSVANWLYTTARRVAATADRAAKRRDTHERRVTPHHAPSVLDLLTGREAFALLDEELERLPPRYREPLVLCYLEGLTRDEAAGRLGVPPATLKCQLDRGRQRLGAALLRRGVTLGAGLLAAVTTASAAPFPARLPATILTTIGGAPPPAVAGLAQGVIMTTTIRPTVALLATVLALGFGLATLPLPAAPQKATADPPVKVTPPAPGEDKPADKAADKPVPLKGKVVGADDKPVTAELRLVRIDVRAAEPTGTVESLGKTKADGTFDVAVAPARPAALLVAHADGHGAQFVVVRFDPADSAGFNRPAGPKAATGEKGPPREVVATPERAVEVTLRLPEPHPIRGRVVDAEGKPVAGATVAVRRVVAFDSGSADRHLKDWSDPASARGGAPRGDREFALPPAPADRAAGSPFVLATDKDGRFETAAFGAETLVEFAVGGVGVSDRTLLVFNRRKFDPKPFNDAPSGQGTRTATAFGPVGQKPLAGPEPTVVVEREKELRGVVTDVKTGRPRAGVRVSFSLADGRPLYPNVLSAVTDEAGRYRIRGAKKCGKYMVECEADAEAGYLPCQAFGDDTAGYEPVAIDLKCAKGVIVSGRMTDKATGKPVTGFVDTAVLANNAFVATYPTSTRSAIPQRNRTDADGKFRLVALPGHTLLMASPGPVGPTRPGGDPSHLYAPETADPKFPDYFHTEYGGLGYYGTEGRSGIVQGCWCKVIDAKEADAEVQVPIALEAATAMTVRVADAAGKGVTGTHASGITHHPWRPAAHFPKADTLTVYNVDPKAGRLLAVAHPDRGEVGAATVRPGDKDPVVKLGPAGKLTGRLVDPAGKPLAGVSVSLFYHSAVVASVSRSVSRGRERAELGEARQVTTDADGAFQFDLLFPGQEFRLLFRQGKKVIGPDYREAEARTVGKPGETLKLGDIQLDPSAAGKE